MLRERVQQELAVPDSDKTAAMLRLENKFKLPIIILIEPRDGIRASDIAEELGITEYTISKWRKRLGFKNVRRVPPGKTKKDSESAKVSGS